jgi:GAF domain-containing protein/HAMP domain-containing protein
MNENEKNIPQRHKIPFWRQLRWSLILFFTLLAVAPVIAAVIITLTREIEQTREQIHNQLTSVAELKRDQITRWLDQGKAAINLVLAEPARKDRFTTFTEASLLKGATLDAADQNALNDLLRQTVEAEAVFEELFLYNANGDVIAASDSTQIGKIVTVQPYFSASLTEEVLTHPPYYKVGTNELTMFLTYPLANKQTGQIIGVLAGRLNLDTLNQIMTKRTGLGVSGVTYLVSRENNYLLTSSREGDLFTHAYHSEGIDRVLTGEDGAGIYADYRKPSVQVLGVFRWMPELQAGLLAEIDEAEALNSYVQSRNFTIVLTGVTILVAVFVGLFVATYIARPIINLTQIAASIAAGNLNQRARFVPGNEIGVLATAFNSMTDQLRALIGSLEERIASRTRRLEIVTNVSERVSAILEVDPLLIEVVNQVQKHFRYYHAHIYLLDEQSKNLVVAAGTGQAGETMKQAGHSIPLNAQTSLVARAARSGQVVRVDNVYEAEDWLPNRLLPDTRSEMAIPIVLGVENQVVGVLDVQEDKIAGLDESDANVLRSLANQVAVAIRNARLFKQVETALAEARMAQERYTAQVWQDTKRAQGSVEHLYVRPAASPIPEVILEEGEKQALTQQQPAIISVYDQVSSDLSEETLPVQQTLIAPVKLGGQVIGALQLHRASPSTSVEPAMDAWAEQDLAFVEAVLDQLAQTAENLRLFEETREQAARERLIGQIGDKFRRAPDLETLLKLGVEELSRVLKPNRTFIRLGTETELAGIQQAKATEIGAAEELPTPVTNGKMSSAKNGQGDQSHE